MVSICGPPPRSLFISPAQQTFQCPPFDLSSRSRFVFSLKNVTGDSLSIAAAWLLLITVTFDISQIRPFPRDPSGSPARSCWHTWGNKCLRDSLSKTVGHKQLESEDTQSSYSFAYYNLPHLSHSAGSVKVIVFFSLSSAERCQQRGLMREIAIE